MKFVLHYNIRVTKEQIYLPDVLSLTVVEQRRVAADLHLLDQATLHSSVNLGQLDLGVFLQKQIHTFLSHGNVTECANDDAEVE